MGPRRSGGGQPISVKFRANTVIGGVRDPVARPAAGRIFEGSVGRCAWATSARRAGCGSTPSPGTSRTCRPTTPPTPPSRTAGLGGAPHRDRGGVLPPVPRARCGWPRGARARAATTPSAGSRSAARAAGRSTPRASGSTSTTARAGRSRLTDAFAGRYAEAAGGRKVTARLAPPTRRRTCVPEPWALRATDLDVLAHVNNAVVLGGGGGGAVAPPRRPRRRCAAEIEHRTAVEPGAVVTWAHSARRRRPRGVGAGRRRASPPPPACARWRRLRTLDQVVAQQAVLGCGLGLAGVGGGARGARTSRSRPSGPTTAA